MSVKYDEYLKAHITNVEKALRWMADNLPSNNIVRENDISEALANVSSHDRSKWNREEYDAYDRYFYGENRSYEVVTAFDYAWLIHQKRNPHHWQYWVLIKDGDTPEDSAQIKPLMIPVVYILEMIADWWSFSWTSENLYEIFAWYEKHKKGMILHYRTRKIVEDILDAIKKKLDEEKGEENDGSNGENSQV